MRNSAEFSRAFKGTRGGSSRLLIAIDSDREENRADLRPVKVGFIIPRSVGNSVVRHRLYRQLRHIVRIRIDNFGPGDMVVIRVFPQARWTGASPSPGIKRGDVGNELRLSNSCGTRSFLSTSGIACFCAEVPICAHLFAVRDRGFRHSRGH